MTTTPILGLTDLASGQAVPESTVNESLRAVEQGARHFVVEDKDLATPPGSPADGAAYIVAGSPTGAWSGWAGRIAHYSSSLGWKSLTPSEGWFAWVKDENKLYYHNGSAWVEYNPTSGTPFELVVACSDEITALTAGTAKLTFRMPFAGTLTAVRCSLTTAQTSGSIFTVDINEGGSSILSTKLTIDNGEKTSVTAATPAVISDSALADDAEMAIDVDQIGDGTAKGLKVALIGTRA